MKMIASRQLTANPGKIWDSLEKEGLFVITKDGMPRAILLPTSDQTVSEDIKEETFRRARQAVGEMRHAAALQGFDNMTLDEINTEIAAARRERKSKSGS